MRLPLELDAQVREHASRSQLTVSGLVRLLLQAYVNHEINLFGRGEALTTEELARELAARREEDLASERAGEALARIRRALARKGRDPGVLPGSL